MTVQNLFQIIGKQMMLLLPFFPDYCL